MEILSSALEISRYQKHNVFQIITFGVITFSWKENFLSLYINIFLNNWYIFVYLVYFQYSFILIKSNGARKFWKDVCISGRTMRFWPIMALLMKRILLKTYAPVNRCLLHFVFANASVLALSQITGTYISFNEGNIRHFVDLFILPVYFHPD